MRGKCDKAGCNRKALVTVTDPKMSSLWRWMDNHDTPGVIHYFKTEMCYEHLKLFCRKNADVLKAWENEV